MTLLDPEKALQSGPRREASLCAVWFGVRAEVTRGMYLASGLGLMLFKYAVEAGLLYYFTQNLLTPWYFFNPVFGVRIELLQPAPEWVAWTMFWWTLPFVWIALSMSVRRAADAGFSPWFGVLVLIPVVNFFIMGFLAILPSVPRSNWTFSDSTEIEHRNVRPNYQQMLLAIGVGLLVGLAELGLSVYFFDLYGASLFFGTPLLMGAISAFIYNRPHAQSLARTMGVVGLLMLVAGGVLLLFALEGAICIAMAAPLVLPLGFIGGAIGKAIADSTGTSVRHTISLLLILPVLTGAESLYRPSPEYMVLTTVEIDAPPEIVWPYVVQFPDLSAPDEWYFQAGIACPLRARIEGHGVGAVRYCEFTTGTFVEPITVWDEPSRLAFDVTEQPDPMLELSPYHHVHPPHLDHHTLNSRRGEFRLIGLPGGRTRLEGRTWYTFEMFPQGYWTLWSDSTIHRIHLRVLRHIKQLAETE
ncbi:MAG TPA: SRPBCC family protein [Planctomycetaceae bacterium]|nr:SRPBCC family protein [Planctomycetaceae bacterium]